MHFISENRLGFLVENLSLVGIVYDLSALQVTVETGERYVPNEEISNNYVPSSTRIACSEVDLSRVKEDLELSTNRQRDHEQLREQGVDIDLLTQAFRNFASKEESALRSISLEVAVCQGDARTKLPPRYASGSKRILEAASRTFSLTMTCLCESQLSVQALQVSSKKPDSLCCGLPTDALARFEFDTLAFRACFEKTTVFSIRISDMILQEDGSEAQCCGDPMQDVQYELHDQQDDLAPLMTQLRDERNYSRLPQLLRLCGHLEELEICGWRIIPVNSWLRETHQEMRRRHVYYLAQMSPLTRLRRVRLGGLSARSEDLATFFNNHKTSLRDVELTSISIREGSYGPTFACLSGLNGGLETLHLDDLWENHRLVHFVGDREQEYTKISGPSHGRNVVRRWGPDVKKGTYTILEISGENDVTEAPLVEVPKI